MFGLTDKLFSYVAGAACLVLVVALFFAYGELHKVQREADKAQTALAKEQRDLVRFDGALKQCVRVPLHQAEYDVYVEHAYNIGSGAFCASTIVKRLNVQDYAGACDAILMWRRVGAQDCSQPGNRICWGLWERRLAAHAKCMGAQ